MGTQENVMHPGHLQHISGDHFHITKGHTHTQTRALGSAALFYSRFYCVIVIQPGPVTHTVLSDHSMA